MTEAHSRPSLTVGLILLPDFTLLALAGFLDTLRLAADEGDRSRPIHCSWTTMSEGGHPVRASCGATITPDSPFQPPERFDYVVVVGGTLHRGPNMGATGLTYLRSVAERHVPLIGICTGGFALARAGLMRNRRCCVSWFHREELAAEFPDMSVISDELYVFDGDRITCAGGTSVIHLASELVERHVGRGRSEKGLRVMLEERARSARSPQPPPPVAGLDAVTDLRVRRAMLLMERSMQTRIALAQVSEAVGTTTRQLSRLFKRETGMSPAQFRERLRLERTRGAVMSTREPLTRIAAEHGFSDAAHFSRRYRAHFGKSPSADRHAGLERSEARTARL